MSRRDSDAPAALRRLCSLPRDIIVNSVVGILDACVRANDEALHGEKGIITRFHSKSKTELELHAYYGRVAQYMPCPTDAIILSMHWLDRVSRQTAYTPVLPGIPSSRESAGGESPIPIFCSYTIHRLVCSSLCVATKFTSDRYIAQVRAAKVAGVSTTELVRLEVELFKALHWRLHFSVAEVNNVAIAILTSARDAGLLQDPLPGEALVLGPVPDVREHPTVAAGVDGLALFPLPSATTGDDDNHQSDEDAEESGRELSRSQSRSSDEAGSDSSLESKEWREWKAKDKMRSLRARAESESSRHAKNLSIVSANSIESF